MMFKTAVTELLAIEYPIIQGGLQGLGIEPLVSAVSEAGGLGLLTAGSYASTKEFYQDIEMVRKKTTKPFGVNLALGIRRPMDEFVEAVVNAEVGIVFTSGYSPVQYMEQFKQAGITVVHVVPSVKFAKKAEELGCDAVVIVGFECGGHPGLDDVSTLSLVPQVVEAVKIPVIAAGGLTDGKGLVTALALGAGAVQMGTRFVMTKECPLPEAIKTKLLRAGTSDTVIIKRSINKPNRVYNNAAAKSVLELERKGAGINELMPYIGGEAYQKMLSTGNSEIGILSIGQAIGRINSCESVQDVITSIMEESCEVLRQLNGYLDR
ncbi:nitronate monooxygenase [Peribacillus psychrosaccharolyticus]|nr:nitronate monooxygenase [Peribacillus psychrosaccharolyticus]MEC2053906.1 nitronate monooxygenase [Peribacillus psychrosaccharolyticus]MED3742480.1 nitronate monooxygenase [Peribacillus psychrosaccharolyticus]